MRLKKERREEEQINYRSNNQLFNPKAGMKRLILLWLAAQRELLGAPFRSLIPLRSRSSLHLISSNSASFFALIPLNSLHSLFIPSIPLNFIHKFIQLASLASFLFSIKQVDGRERELWVVGLFVGGGSHNPSLPFS